MRRFLSALVLALVAQSTHAAELAEVLGVVSMEAENFPVEILPPGIARWETEDVGATGGAIVVAATGRQRGHDGTHTLLPPHLSGLGLRQVARDRGETHPDAELRELGLDLPCTS